MMVAPTFFLTPNMMQAVLIYAFAAAVLGGLESPVGAVVGGIALGVILQMLDDLRRLRHARPAAADGAGRAARRPARAPGRPARPPGGEAGMSEATSGGWPVARLRRARARRRRHAARDRELPDVPARSRRGLPDRPARAEHPDRLHRPDLARPRRVRGHRRVHDDDPRRRPRLARSLDDSDRRRRRRRARARVRADRDALRRPVPRARDVRDPALLHRAAEAVPALHRRRHRQEPAAAARRVRPRHESVDLVLRRHVGRRARDAAARALHRPRTLRPRAPRGARQRDRLDGERRLDGRDQDRRLRDLRILLRRRRRRSTRSASPTSIPTPSRSSCRSCCSSGS